jgi:hypothetical protein
MVAAMRPASTSPDPAVASAGVPEFTTRSVPDGLARIVMGPFSRTTHPVSFARDARTASKRFAGTGRPVRRENSPSWGVRIHRSASLDRSGQQRAVQPVRVEHHGDRHVRQSLPQPRRGIKSEAGSRHDCATAPIHRQLDTVHHLRRQPHEARDVAPTGQADHRRSPGQGATRHQFSGTRHERRTDERFHRVDPFMVAPTHVQQANRGHCPASGRPRTARRCPSPAKRSSPISAAAGPLRWAGFTCTKGQRHIGRHRRTKNLTRVAVHSRRQVDGQHQRSRQRPRARGTGANNPARTRRRRRGCSRRATAAGSPLRARPRARLAR